MKCPLCNVEMRIKASDYVMNDGNLFLRQILTCRKRDCPNYEKDVKNLYEPLTVSEDTQAEATEPEPLPFTEPSEEEEP